MVSCPAQTYHQHVLSPLGGRAAASLPVGDGRNTDDLQVTQVMAVCKSSANAQQLHRVQPPALAAADSSVSSATDNRLWCVINFSKTIASDGQTLTEKLTFGETNSFYLMQR